MHAATNDAGVRSEADGSAREQNDDATSDDGFSPPPVVPDAWQRVIGECSISLRGPELVATEGDSMDYCVATFADPDCTYRVEYGAFSDPFAHAAGPDFSFENVRIQDNPGRLVTALYRLNSDAYVVGLHVPAFAGDPPEYSLSATARCASPEALESARIVLQTFDVPHVGSGPCTPVRPQKCTPS